VKAEKKVSAVDIIELLVIGPRFLSIGDLETAVGGYTRKA
jgi:hypothetical protein